MRISDWSSDVCSSDLVAVLLRMEIDGAIERILEKAGIEPAVARYAIVFTTETEGGIESAVVKGSHVVGVFRTSDEDMDRSEERRVGKEGVSTCRSRWSPYP